MQLLNFIFKLFLGCSPILFGKTLLTKIYVMLCITRYFYVNARYFICCFPRKYWLFRDMTYLSQI